MTTFLTVLAILFVVTTLISRSENNSFPMYSVGVGFGGDFWLLPGVKSTKIKNVEMVVFGWLYFFVSFQALAKRPTNVDA